MKRKEITATTGPAGNLGLGLYIADRIVSAHKGRIEVQSSDEAGTTFEFGLEGLENFLDDLRIHARTSICKVDLPVVSRR